MRGMRNRADGMARAARILRQAVYGPLCWETSGEDRCNQGTHQDSHAEKALSIYLHFTAERTGRAGMARNDIRRFLENANCNSGAQAISALFSVQQGNDLVSFVSAA